MERLMQYVWKHRLWAPSSMHTVDGRHVRVIDPGLENTNSGPDFFNAKIMIDDRLWAGDVEIHVRASDWHRHNHDGDPAYDSVILHVVDRDDDVILRSNGEAIPQMRMPCTPDFHRHYSALVDRADIDLPCASTIPDNSSIYIVDWLSTLAYERLYDKSERISSLLSRLGGDWESVCYVTVARALGFGINGDPFERLALSLPLNFIGKHSDSLFSIEALLFGQSGLLDDAVSRGDSYAVALAREYAFMAHKFGLSKPQSLGWKMSRMRPANFPHRRIATLAAMLHGGFRMMSRFLDIKNIDDAETILSPSLTGYWEHRYSFGAESPQVATRLSRSSIAGIVINAVVPLMYAYADSHARTELADHAVELLQTLPPERNSIIDLFARAGIKATDAFTSQALIQLRKAYCQNRKCLYCRIGHRLLSSRSRRP